MWQMRARHNATKTRTPRAKREKIEVSSGNVFADLGFEDSEERLRKAKLIAQPSKKKRRRTQTARTD